MEVFKTAVVLFISATLFGHQSMSPVLSAMPLMRSAMEVFKPTMVPAGLAMLPDIAAMVAEPAA